jgi:hypothetical protein
MKTARRLVAAVLELPAGMERGEDDLERALLRLRVLVHRYAAPVVSDRDRRSVVVQRERDIRGVAVHRLVDRVVEDLPHEMVQPRAPDASNVHAGTLANGLEALEDGDVFCGVG